MKQGFDLVFEHAIDLGLRTGDLATDEGALLFSETTFFLRAPPHLRILSLRKLLENQEDPKRESIALQILHRLKSPPDQDEFKYMMSLHWVSETWSVRWHWGNLRRDVLGRALAIAGVLHSNAWKYEP